MFGAPLAFETQYISYRNRNLNMNRNMKKEKFIILPNKTSYKNDRNDYNDLDGVILNGTDVSKPKFLTPSSPRPEVAKTGSGMGRFMASSQPTY
jgi:hypothetical protein